MIKIIDNFLETDLKNFLEKYFLEMPHYYGHTSITDSDKDSAFYMTTLDLYNPLVKFLCTKIQKLINYKIGFLRVYINVQYSNMPGAFHFDDGDTTILLMISKTLQKGSGQFQIKINNEENNVQSVDFVQNRLIIFPAKWEHKGLDPIEHATPRITLAFKTKII